MNIYKKSLGVLLVVFASTMFLGGVKVKRGSDASGDGTASDSFTADNDATSGNAGTFVGNVFDSPDTSGLTIGSSDVTGVTISTDGTGLSVADNAAEPGNLVRINDNDTAFTNDPTCANSGSAGTLTILDTIEGATEGWAICDGITEIFGIPSSDHTQTECIYLPATDIVCDDATGCTDPADFDGTNFSFKVAAYADGASDLNGGWTIVVPSNISGTTLTATVYWHVFDVACTNEATTDDVCWTVASVGIADDESLGAASVGTSQGVQDTCTASGDLMVAALADPITHGWADGDIAHIEVTRDIDGGHADCGADQLAATANLVALEICYEVDNVFSGE